MDSQLTYSLHPGLRHGDPSSSNAGDSRCMKAVLIWSGRIERHEDGTWHGTHDDTRAEVFCKAVIQTSKLIILYVEGGKGNVLKDCFRDNVPQA